MKEMEIKKSSNKIAVITYKVTVILRKQHILMLTSFSIPNLENTYHNLQ